MIRQAISCDVCGTEKRQTNHWFVAFEQSGELRLGGWTSRNRSRPGSKHLCGQTCLHKLVDEYMARMMAAKASQSITNDATDDYVEIEEAPQQLAQTDTDLRNPRNRNIAAKKPTPAPAREVARSAVSDSNSRLVAPAEAWLEPDAAHAAFAAERFDFDPDESSARLITPAETASERLRPSAQFATPNPTTVASSRPSLVQNKSLANKTLVELPLTDESPSFSSRKWRAEAWERERERELRAANDHSGIAARLRPN